MQTRYHSHFIKQLRKAPADIRSATIIRIDMFSENPNYPLLHDHALTGKYLGYRSINITGDWRAIYQVIDSVLDDTYAHFIALGTHSQLYK